MQLSESGNAARSGRQRNRTIDLDVAAVLIGERSIGEIFGWDLVDWPAVEPYKSRKFHFERQRRLDPCIYDQLKPLFDRCHHEADDFQLLKPSPVVNDNLTKLVSYLCRHFGEHHLPAPAIDDIGHKRTAEQEKLHQGVTTHILKRIEADPTLSRRAEALKKIACAAEGELEKHFSDQINDRIEQDFLAGGVVDKLRLRSLQDQARTRADVTSELNRIELAGLSMPDLDQDDKRQLQIEMAKILLHRFPYVRNYELMLFAELTMLQQPLMPRFIRERTLGKSSTPVDEPTMLRFDRAVADLGKTLDSSTNRGWSGLLTGKTIAFCGSGALPLSALLMHLMTGAKVILVDHDQQAILRSKRLISNLERLEILLPGALELVQQNAGDVRFHGTGGRPKVHADTSIACDAVMVASLVDPCAKSKIANQFRDNQDAPDLLIMRSVGSLSAKLAYDPIPTEVFSSLSIPYCGETLPATQVATQLDRLNAIRQGVTSSSSKELLATAHPDVVNTTEIYRKLRPTPNAAPFDPTQSAFINEGIQKRWIELNQRFPTIPE